MMSGHPADDLTPRLQGALDELQALILARYPDTRFRVTRSPDEPEVTHLLATVDVDDTDAVLDAVIDRMMDMQIAEGLPIYVIPLRPPERASAMSSTSLDRPTP